MCDVKNIVKYIRVILIMISVFGVMNCEKLEVYANAEKTDVKGTVFQFTDKVDYDLSKADKSLSTSKAETFGVFSISGNISSTSEKAGIPCYAVSEGNLYLFYTYDDKLLKASKDENHLVEDNGKKVNGIALDGSVGIGTIILQTSKDGKIWFDVPEQSRRNIFEEKPVEKKAFYETTNVQMVNGCYYRVIVAYKTGIRTQKAQKIPPKLEKYKYQRYAEVYTFYAFDENAKNIQEPENDNRRNLGSKVRVSSNGYSGEKEINNKDPHFGWDIGQFFMGGYTDCEKDSDGAMLFLKNNGDKLSLWFELQQDINKCYENSAIKVIKDNEGSDTYFGVPGGANETLDFGRGALIIRKTNPDGTIDKPQIFTNYLEASASVDSVTKVDLLEEGDYEVALDYAMKFDKTKILGRSILPETAKYRIFFKLKVRNGNSMVFLMDTMTGSEISSGSVTENGFRIDFANSQYLKVNVKRDVLKEGYNGPIWDTRFNSSASDGDIFTDEGVYTITVTNQYNGAITEKQVYVGSDSILKAYMVTGLDISDIRERMALGATIDKNGNITLPDPKEEKSK